MNERTPLLVDAHAAGEILGISLSLVRDLTRRGVLPHVRFPGSRLIRYRPGDLEEFVAQHVRRPTGGA